MQPTEQRHPSRLATRIGEGFCFLVAVVLTALGVWLCLLGEFPAIKTGGNGVVTYVDMSINGVALPDSAFYLISVAFFTVAAAVGFAGWRLHKVNRARTT